MNDMNFFSNNFPDHDEEKKKLELEHQRNLELAKGSRSETEKENARYRKSLSTLATEILKEDSRRKLEFPFELNADTVDKLKAYPEYYKRDGIISQTFKAGHCEVCGKKITSGDIVVSDEVSNVTVCLGCADTKHPITIDNKNFRVRAVK